MSIPLEHEIQSAFVQEVLYKYSNDPRFVEPLFYAVASGFVGGGKNKFALINKLKREGWKNGIADIHYDQPRGDYSKMVIEFKRENRRNAVNGGLSDEQKEYLDALGEYAFACVCYTVEEAISKFDYYMSFD